MTDESIWVGDRDTLRQAGRAWQQLRVVGFDTEFVRTDTYFPRPGLYQISDGDRVWLVDPIALPEFGELAELLTDPAIIKVVHACGEDIELLASHLALTPVNLFDTQLAWAFSGGRWEAGYAELARELLGLELDKSATRSNWCARPLSAAQQSYAAADARHLVALYGMLAERLGEAGRGPWMGEEMQRKIAASVPVAAADYYRSMAGAARLRGAHLSALRALAAWREETAGELNRPRQRVVSDADLCAIAGRLPRSRSALGDLLSPGAQRRFGQQIVDVLAAAGQAPELPPWAAPLSRKEGERVAQLRAQTQQRAAHFGIAQELLARRRLIEALVREGRAQQVPMEWQGWRQAAMGADWVAAAGAAGSPQPA